jgi:hypothetical protein
MVASNISPRPKQTAAFWNRPWVQNVLPLATSLMLHAGIIVLGIALYQAVKTMADPNRDQVVIPQMKGIEKPQFGTLDSTPLSIRNPRPAGVDAPDIPMGGPSTAARGMMDPDLFAGPESAGRSGPGTVFDRDTSSGPFRMPGGAGDGSGPGVRFTPQSHANGRTVVFLCDASGSMLSVFGRLKQELKQSINDLDLSQAQEFNVVFFSDANYTALFKDGTHLATPENKKIAMNFIGDAICAGGTLPIPAINFAMSEKPELIFVLTDGFDQIANLDDVEKAFKTGNWLGKTHINCIFLQSDEDPKLEQVLKRISIDGHGNFVKILKLDL